MTTNWRTRIFHTTLWHKICSSFQSTSLLCIQLNSYKYKCVYPFTFSTVRSCSDPRGIEFPPTFRAILIIKPRWPQSMLHTKYKPLSISICPVPRPLSLSGRQWCVLVLGKIASQHKFMSAWHFYVPRWRFQLFTSRF